MNRRLCCFFILISFLLFTTAEISAQENFNIECISTSHFNWIDGVHDVAVNGNTAYLACLRDGLYIVDISDFDSPRELSHLNSTWYRYVEVAGNYLYTTDSNTGNGINVVDVSDPENPVIVDNIEVDGSVRSITIIDNLLYAGNGGYTIVDISDPLNCEILFRSEPVSTVLDVEREGDILYLASEWKGLQVIDISDFDHPDTLGSFSADHYNWVNGLAVKDGYAYLAHGWLGLIVVDLETMEQVAQIDSLYYAFNADIVGGLLYLNYGDPDCPLAIINIDDPLNPQTVGVYYPPEDLWNFTIKGSFAYIADMHHGLRIVDISDSANPTEIASYNRYGHNYEVQVAGNLAFLREDIKLSILDVSDPANPHEVSYLEPSWGYNDFALDGNIVYLVRHGYECLYAMDFTDPVNPMIVGEFTTEDTDIHYRILLYDHYAYMVENQGLRIIDVSDPTTLTEVGFFAHNLGNATIGTEGHYLFLENSYHHIEVFDISDPLNPVHEGTWDTGGYCKAITSRDNLVFTSIGGEVRIYDLDNLSRSAPTEIIDIFGPYMSSINELEIRGELLYVALSYGIVVLNVEDISNPVIVASYETFGHANDMSVIGNMIYLADYSNFGVYRCAVVTNVTPVGPDAIASSFTLMSNYPNPFNSTTQIRFEVAGQYHVSLAVFDMLGRQVTTLTNQNFSTGTHVIPWNGTNASGQEVASGKYFVMAKANNAVSTIPVVLLK